MSGPVNLLSLGAGVQSSAMALMAARGEIEPMPVAAVFADTQDETKRLYRWLAWIERELPYTTHVVTKGKLSDAALKIRVSKKGQRYSKTDIPFFTRDPKTGALGRISSRACTRDYKLRQLVKKAREYVDLKGWRRRHAADLREIREIAEAYKGKKTKWAKLWLSDAWKSCQADPLAVQWVGISLDELGRGKPSREPWIVVRHPLLERRITRQRCKDWMRERGYPEPPRSACVYCPFHSDAEWLRLKEQEPAEFAKAVAFELDYQRAAADGVYDSTPYLHRSCKPLGEIDFREIEDRQPSLWQDECEGNELLDSPRP